MDRTQPPVEIQRTSGAAIQHRFKGIRAHTLIEIVAAQPIHDEREYRFDCFFSADRRLEASGGLFQQRLQIQIKLAFNHNPQHAQGRSAQRERIFGPRRRLADSKNANQGIQPFSQGQRPTRCSHRQAVAGEAWQILLFQGLGDFRRFLIMQGVIATHDALKLRELLHHLTEQVAFRQPRRPFGPVGIAVTVFGDEPRQRRHPFAFFRLRTQSLLKHHLLECFHPRRQRLFAILIPEKFGVAETRTDHPLVARPHLRRIAAFQIGHGDEMRQESAFNVHHREIALIILHGADQGFGGHIEKTLLKIAGQRYRPFHQRRHFIEQIRLDDCYAIELISGGFGLGAHRIAALVKVGNHPAFTGELPGVLRRRSHPDRIGMMEAMAASFPARLDAENRGRNHLVAKQQDGPMHRTDKFIIAVAPAHPLGNRQRRQGREDNAGNQVGGGGTRFGTDMHQPDAFIGLLLLQLGDGDPAGAGKAFSRFGGLTV